jgi:putative tricarboxylic transport membrane protein
VKRFDKIGSIVCLIVAAAAIWQSAIIPMGRISKPGPGFLPFWVGIILALLSGVLWTEASLRKPSADQVRFLSGEGKWQYVVFAALSLLAYTGLMEILGFRLSTFLLLIFLFWFVGKQKWWVVLTGASLVTVFTHLIFRVALKVQLPVGLLRF